VIVASAVSLSAGAASESAAPVALGDPSQAGTPAYSVLYSCTDADCFRPRSLIQGTDGNLYGTSVAGVRHGGGTVFRLTPQGEFSLLHTFTENDDHGCGPQGLVQASNGDFYGTTSGCGPFAAGTIYRLSPSGAFATLHRFHDTNDGALPNGPLVQATDGNLYGTALGGISSQGLVFRVSPEGGYKVIYAFNSNVPAPEFNGTYPGAPLTQGRDGFLYGTTTAGGRDPDCVDCGTVFRMSLEGHVQAWASLGGPEGQLPAGALLEAANGKRIGTAAAGGNLARPNCQHLQDCFGFGCGTLFRLAPNGTFTVLHRFHDSPLDGAAPVGPLVQGSDGALYGTTEAGGANRLGAVFRLQLSTP
jgi:uncharacterized repeat protein (TIGR03803 family)